MSDHPNLTHPSEVRALLAELDFHPSRVLGQNFLIDLNILHILLAGAELEPSDAVVEVGPGLGVLTAALLDRVATVVAVEKDNRLAPYLRQRFAGEPRLTLIHADILDCDLAALFPGPGGKLVANLPYAIAARLLVDLSALPRTPPARIVATIQREVADRLGLRPPRRTTACCRSCSSAITRSGPSSTCRAPASGRPRRCNRPLSS
jgi:16S rRNA (adenine1518-N6/adenine1519-N6)-dimethyltransferase